MAAKSHVVRTSRDRDRRERDPSQLQQGAAFLHFQRSPPPGQWSADVIAQSNHYTGTIYLGLSRTAQVWASARAMLEIRKRKDRTTFGPGGSVAVIKAVSNDGGAGNDEDYEPCDDHPILSHLMAEANQTESFGSMLGYMAVQYGLTGEAPVWFVPNDDGKPVELYALPRAMCQPQPVSPQYPHGYWRVNQYYGSQAWSFGVLGTRMASSTILPGEEVQRLIAYNPFTRQAGYSPLQACAIQIDIGESIDLARHSHMQQGIQTGTVVYIPGLDQAQAELVAAGLRERFAGARNARKPMIASAPPGATGEMKVEQLSESAKELDFIQSLQYTTNYIAAALDVPPAVLGVTDNDSYAKAYAVRQEMHDRQQGRLKGVGDFFTRHLCGPWSKKPGEYRCKITLPPVQNRERDTLSASEMAQHGIVLVNELRRMNDLEPINGGDLPPSVFVKWVEQQAMPQPEPQPGAMPGMDAGGAPVPVPGEQPGQEQPQQGDDEADPLASLMGGAPQPSNPAAAGSLPPRPGTVEKARQMRTEGQTWQVGTNWYTKRNGKTVKTADPNRQRGPTKKDERATARTAKEEGKAKATAAADKLVRGGAGLTHEDVKHLDDHFATLTADKMKAVARAIGQKVGGAKAELAKRLVEHAKKLAAGGGAAPAPTAKPDTPHGKARAALDAMGLPHAHLSDSHVADLHDKIRALHAGAGGAGPAQKKPWSSGHSAPTVPAAKPAAKPVRGAHVDASEKAVSDAIEAGRTPHEGGTQAHEAEADKMIADLTAKHSPAELREIAKRTTGKGGRNARESIELIKNDITAVTRLRETQRV